MAEAAHKATPRDALATLGRIAVYTMPEPWSKVPPGTQALATSAMCAPSPPTSGCSLWNNAGRISSVMTLSVRWPTAT